MGKKEDGQSAVKGIGGPSRERMKPGRRCRLILLPLALSAFFLAISLLLIVALLLKSPKETGKEEEEYAASLWGCTSLNCSLNLALDPCDDFYEFVCSGFMNKTGGMPAEYTVKSQFNILWHKSWMDLIGLLNNQAIRQNAKGDNADDNPSLTQQMFLFYDACVDNRSREANKTAGLFGHLEAIKYRPAGKIHSFDTQWMTMAFPFVPFFNFQTTWDVRPETETKGMLLFEPRRTLTDYGQLMDARRRNEFEQKMTKLLEYIRQDEATVEGTTTTFFEKGLSAEQYDAEIRRRIDSLVQMELRIGHALDSYDGADLVRFSNFSATEKYLSIDGLILAYSPSIDWLPILRQLSPPPTEGGADLNGSTPVLILGHGLLLAYRQIIESVERENPQMLADYLDWALIWPLLFEMDQRFGAVMAPWRKDELNCIRNFVRLYFKHFLDRLYMEHVLVEKQTATTMDETRRIFSYLKREFSGLIDGAEWMEQASKEKAKRKLAQLKEHIGYFRLIDDDRLMRELYGNYALRQGMPWAQMFAHVHRQFYLWPTLDYQGSYWVDGFYKWVYNSLAIYAGIIHPPWFDPALPPVVNFGAMGTFIGHEITHGYDSAGWHFDGKGNMRSQREEMADKGTMEGMERRMQCFVDQYGQYEGELERPNPRFTLAENIADNGAIRVSHRAWQHFKAENPEEASKKPGRMEKFGDEQIFFISSAFMYCAAMPAMDDVQKHARTDNHAMPRARVNLPLRNFDAFARAFNCPVGSKMNSKMEQKCRLW